MAGMPDIITKPPFLERLDWLSRTINYSELKKIIKQLEPHLAADGFLNVAKAAGLLPDAEVKHLRDHWLGRSDFFKNVDEQVRLEVLRTAMLEAAKLVKHRHLPLDSWWACGALKHAEKPFQASLTLSAQQITLILHTPKPGIDYPTIEDPRVKIVRYEAGHTVVEVGKHDDD